MRPRTEQDGLKKLHATCIDVTSRHHQPGQREWLCGAECPTGGNRLVLPQNLMGIAEVAWYFNVGKSTVSQWASRRESIGMPEPVAALDCGTVYDITELVPWWIGWNPVRGKKAGSLPQPGASKPVGGRK